MFRTDSCVGLGSKHKNHMTQKQGACIREEYMGSITARLSGLEMVAMGLMSDAQELMTFGHEQATDSARKNIINIAKFILSEMMESRLTEKFRSLAYNEIRDYKATRYISVSQKLENFISSIEKGVRIESLPQKCGMDREDSIAVDLNGNVLTCQNVSVTSYDYQNYTCCE